MKSTLFRLTLASLVLFPLGATAQVDAGDDVVLECESANGTEYTLNGTAPTGEGIVNEWTTDPMIDLENADTLTPTGVFPLGVTTATLTSTPAGGAPESDSATVTVEDTEAPVVRAKADPWFLWPPNHELREVNVHLRIADRCSSADDFTVELVDVKSSEADNGRGDGNSANDIQGADIGTDDRSVELRAERSGSGRGRIYTLVYRVADGAGNETQAEAKVYVPHDASDLKDRVGDGDRDHSDMAPICPRPSEAVDALGAIFPGLGSVRDETTCNNVCKAWTKSCNQIGAGSAKCVAGETRALALIAAAECKDSDDRGEVKACRDAAKAEYAQQKAALKEDAQAAKDTCAGHGESCLNACADMFDDSPMSMQ